MRNITNHVEHPQHNRPRAISDWNVGLSMKSAHAGMRITKAEFDALGGDVVTTLNKFKVGKREQSE